MQNISDYINEARIQTGPVEIEYTPKTRIELIDAIKEVAKAQSRRKVLNFNCIDTSAVTSMNSVFYHALSTKPALMNKDFLVDQWDVSNVTSFDSTFLYCKGFTGKDLENWKVTSKCESIGSMFEGCYSLEGIDMSKWDLSGINDAHGMFHEAKSLQSVQFPENMSKLNKTNGLFRWCPALTYVKLPKKTSGNMLFTSEMFLESGFRHDRLVVDNLDSISLPKTDGRSVDKDCKDMFKGCGILPEILKDYINAQNLSDNDIARLGIDNSRL
jgi:surface protein